MSKKILITWHFPHYGIAFLKNIISAIYMNCSEGKRFNTEYICQDDSNEYFDNTPKKGFKFDRIYQISLKQEVFDEITTVRSQFFYDYLDNDIWEGHEELKKACSEMKTCGIKKYDEELEFMERYYRNHLEEFKYYVWHNMHHHSINEQHKWFANDSNFIKVYSTDDFVPVFRPNIKSLKFDEKNIAEDLKKWFIEKESEFSNAEVYFIITLCTPETQVVWHILAEANILPKKSHFLKVYDDKRQSFKFLKQFRIEEISPNIISNIKDELILFSDTKSAKREFANKLFKIYMKTGFSIMLLGERGIGKSRLVSKETGSRKVYSCNCASFADDTMAESEIFGHTKGAFTGANEAKKGLLEEANGGIFFMDEVHHLSKIVQAKLLTAFSTNKDNEMKFRKVGDNKETTVKNVVLVFASNKKLEELGDYLLPDFYDRIAQQVIEIPPLRETREDIKADFESIWKQLEFNESDYPCDDSELFKWLREQPLLGNYRDLQKIAIYYKNYMNFDDAIKEDIKKDFNVESPLEFSQQQYRKYCNIKSPDSLFVLGKTYDQLIEEYRYQLYEWSVKNYGSVKNAAEILDISDKTINNMKNRQ